MKVQKTRCFLTETEHRIASLLYAIHKPLYLTQIENETGLNRAVLYDNLKLLMKKGYITSERRGVEVYYDLSKSGEALSWAIDNIDDLILARELYINGDIVWPKPGDEPQKQEEPPWSEARMITRSSHYIHLTESASLSSLFPPESPIFTIDSCIVNMAVEQDMNMIKYNYDITFKPEKLNDMWQDIVAFPPEKVKVEVVEGLERILKEEKNDKGESKKRTLLTFVFRKEFGMKARQTIKYALTVPHDYHILTLYPNYSVVAYHAPFVFKEHVERISVKYDPHKVKGVPITETIWEKTQLMPFQELNTVVSYKVSNSLLDRNKTGI